MSNWRFPESGVVQQRIGGTTHGMAAVTSGAAAFGAWTSLGGSFALPVDGLIVSARPDTAIGRSFYLSIAIGAGADANTIVDSAYVVPPSAPGWDDTTALSFPVRVPAGQTIFVKTAALDARSQGISVVGISGGWMRAIGAARIEALQTNLATVRPISITANGAWNAVNASTPRRYAGLMIALDVADSANDRRFSARVGLGAAAAEQVIVAEQFASRNGSQGHGSSGLLPVHVPAASRLSVAVEGSAAEVVRPHIMGLVG
jgi:hypothetical protein